MRPEMSSSFEGVAPYPWNKTDALRFVPKPLLGHTLRLIRSISRARASPDYSGDMGNTCASNGCLEGRAYAARIG